MKIFEGTIITCNGNNTISRFLVEDGGRILYVGNELPLQYKNGKRIHLGKRALLPSFADTHMHFASFAMFHSGLNVMNAGSNTEIIYMLQKYVKGNKDNIIIVFGASPHSVEERRLISRRELDAVCKDKPIMVVKFDGHACIINTALLNKVKNKVSKLRGYHEESGEMQQEAFFGVSHYITNSISPLKLINNMKHAIDYIASKGIGLVHTVSGIGFPRDLDVDLERLFGRGLTNGFQLRVYFQTLDVDKVRKRKLERIGGCFATALDGCFGSKDAALLQPYEGTASKGVLFYTDEQVIDFCKKANRAKLQIELHAIGDAAFNQAVKAIKAALEDYPRKDHRHGVIHACLPTKEGLEICRDYGIWLPVQTAFINWSQEPDEYLNQILGKRSESLNPINTCKSYSITMSCGSDAPCTDPDPILWIHNACNHSNPKESVSVYDALRMCTYHGYAASFDEDERGSLEAGKIADMVVLSENPYEVEKENLKNIKVERLYLKGNQYRSEKLQSIPLIVRGMLSKAKI
jgi:predicted amidohydrolase YtcJ